MKTILSIFIGLLMLSCNDNSNSVNLDPNNSTAKRLDSLKWLFYAYTYEGKVLFKKNEEVYEFRPTECEVRVEKIDNRNDSIFYVLNPYKEGYKYNKIHQGLMIYGFAYFKNVYKPLTGMIKLDSFENPEYLKVDNLKTDSIFRVFLKTTESSKLANWLLDEAKKRKVIN